MKYKEVRCNRCNSVLETVQDGKSLSVNPCAVCLDAVYKSVISQATIVTNCIGSPMSTDAPAAINAGDNTLFSI